MSENEQTEEAFKLYVEELEYCLGRSASIRKVSLMSTMIEAQVAWLAEGLMKSKKFKYTIQNKSREYSFYRQVLKDNLDFEEGFWGNLDVFNNQRNFILHNVFKQRRNSRKDLDKSINLATEAGRKVIKHLDTRLMFLGTSEVES